MEVGLCLGADSLMMGNFFARYTEGAGNMVRNDGGEIVKEYWMEGSAKARNHRRYAQLKNLFFEEGITGYVPHLGSIYDKLPIVLQVLRASMATAGCRTIDELHETAAQATGLFDFGDGSYRSNRLQQQRRQQRVAAPV